MQFTNVITAALLSAVALAQPVERANPSQWTIVSMTRTCNSADTSCNYSFGINTNDGSAVTPCRYTVTGSPASRASNTGFTCGAFRTSSNWSGQFGAGNGFTTWAVVRNGKIVYPAYTDKQLVNGKAVTPDMSYNVQNTS